MRRFTEDLRCPTCRSKMCDGSKPCPQDDPHADLYHLPGGEAFEDELAGDLEPQLMVGDRIFSAPSSDRGTVVDADDTHVLIQFDAWGRRVASAEPYLYSRETASQLFTREV